jgi:uncharacterized membrane protein HdeD (DUF308 family)
MPARTTYYVQAAGVALAVTGVYLFHPIRNVLATAFVLSGAVALVGGQLLRKYKIL